MESVSTSDALIRPWRTATIVVSAVALAELVLLLAIGLATFGRPVLDAAQGSVSHGATASKAQTDHKRAAAGASTPVQRREPLGAPTLARAETSVLILNGNGIAGAGGRSRGRSRAVEGLIVAAVGNAERTDYARSVVMYRPGYKPEAAAPRPRPPVQNVSPLDGLAPASSWARTSRSSSAASQASARSTLRARLVEQAAGETRRAVRVEPVRAIEIVVAPRGSGRARTRTRRARTTSPSSRAGGRSRRGSAAALGTCARATPRRAPRPDERLDGERVEVARLRALPRSRRRRRRAPSARVRVVDLPLREPRRRRASRARAEPDDADGDRERRARSAQAAARGPP